MFRISEPQFLDSLLTKGELYLNTVEFYRRQYEENNGYRGDKNEGLSYVKQINNEVVINSIVNKSLYPNIEVSVREWRRQGTGNIMCFYGIREDCIVNGMHTVDDRMFQFGMQGVMITNMPEFFKRIESKCLQLGLNMRYMPVVYRDFSKISGYISPFTKSQEFSYQSEVRLFIESKGDQPIKIEIGSIEDIAVKFQLGKWFKFIDNVNLPHTGMTNV